MARRTRKPAVSRDPYWEIVQSLMPDILSCYEQYHEIRPRYDAGSKHGFRMLDVQMLDDGSIQLPQ